MRNKTIATLAVLVVGVAIILGLKVGLGKIGDTLGRSVRAEAQEVAAPVEDLPDPEGEPFDASSVPIGDETPPGVGVEEVRVSIARWAEKASVPHLDGIGGGLVYKGDDGYPDDPWYWQYEGTASDGTEVAFEVEWTRVGGIVCRVKY